MAGTGVGTGGAGDARNRLEEALREPAPTRGVRVLGLILAPPAMVVTEAQALLAEPAADSGLTGVALVDWVETLLVYKLPRLSREEIRKMLDIFNVELKQTRFYQEVFAEGLEEGHKEGHKEGRQEGRQEGRRQERLRIARSLLDVIADDRLLAEKTGLSEAEVQRLREEKP
jgi:predicted transposase YdaD